MEVFSLVLEQMLMMFMLIGIGIILKKKEIVPDKTGKMLSKLETFAFVPALTLNNQLTKCTVENFTQNGVIMLYGLGCILVAILLSYPLSLLFVKKASSGSPQEYQRNIYKYALTFANYAYVGNFVVKGIWGEDGLFLYLLFTFFMSICCYAWGLFILIPKGQENRGMLKSLKKGLLTPPFIAMVVGIIGGLLGVRKYIPNFVMTGLSNLGNCMGPVGMVLAGIVIGNYSFKKLLTNKKVYLASVLRLILIPAFIVTVLRLLGTAEQITRYALIAFATPFGLNTIIYPAAYGGETETGASMTMISTAFSLVTIPLMYLLFNVVWV